MAGPTLASAISEVPFAGTTTTHNVPMPATVASGAKLIIVWANNRDRDTTTPSGWTLEREIIDHNWAHMNIYSRTADGTEGGTNVNLVTSGTVGGVASVIHITAGTWTNLVVSTGVASDGLPNHNPDSVAASASGTHRFMVAAAVNGHITSQGWTTIPDNYTEDVIFENNGTVGDEDHNTMGICSRELEASSDDPTPIVFEDDDHTVSLTFVIEGTGTAYDQEGFRFRNDDGSESTATWSQNQDVDDTVGAGETRRLRILTDPSGSDPPSDGLLLLYKRTDEPDTEFRSV